MKEKIIEQGTYKIVVKNKKPISIPDLELISKDGEKKHWKVKEIKLDETEEKMLNILLEGANEEWDSFRDFE